MKTKTLFLFIFLAGFQLSYSQNPEKCRTIVKTTIEAINKNDAGLIKPFLARNFTIADQKGFIAKMVLQQLFLQIDETVVSSEEIKAIQTDNGLEIEYLIHYKEMGEKNSTFIFNKGNKITEMKLFDMHVMTMEGEPEPEVSDMDVTEIPFRMAGNLILVDVILEGRKSTFIIDSGSPQTILNSKYVNNHPDAKKKFSVGDSQGVSGNISGVNVNKVGNLDFYGTRLIDQNILTMYLGHLEEEINDTIYGLIGYDLLHNFDIVLDYNKSKLVLVNPGHFKAYEKKELDGYRKSETKLKMQAHIPVVECRVENYMISLGIDTGAEQNLFDDEWYLKLKSVLKNPEKTSLLGADNKPVEVESGQIASLVIGDEQFQQQETTFSDISHLNEGYKIHIDGLIGYEVLSRNITVLSYKQKKMFFYL